MTILAQAFASRPAEDIVLISGDARLTAGEILRLRPVLQPAAERDGLRLALCVQSPLRLLEVLAAYDGHADALLLLDSGLAAELVATIAQEVGCDRIVSDRAEIADALAPDAVIAPAQAALAAPAGPRTATEWIMTTSGTTGVPKTVAHDLGSLSRTVRRWRGAGMPPVWGLTYEPTRFAGMQVVLQAIIGGGRLIAPPSAARFEDKLQAWASAGCTHLSGTPTFWRRVLMHPASAQLDDLRQITLGGEIADQAILDALAQRFPDAQITHIYASTEAGVGFSVKDRRAGFPLDYVTAGSAGADLRIIDGHLWIRQAAAAAAAGSPDEGFIDTLDSVTVEGERVYFLGRDTGAINVGGAKVYPERVEQVICTMPEIALARVTAKRNPFSGSILVAEVLPVAADAEPKAMQDAVVRHCRAQLPVEAVPALVRVCHELRINGAGKIVRG